MELYAGLKTEIAWYKAEVENAGNAARPPAQLYVDGLKFADAGHQFKKVWGSYWHDLLGDQVVEDVDTLSAFDSLVQDESVFWPGATRMTRNARKTSTTLVGV